MMMKRGILGLILIGALLSNACQQNDGRSATIGTADLPCMVDDNVPDSWQSAEWPPVADGDTCFWFRYNGKTTYEIPHPLLRVPEQVIIYISFSSDGAGASIAAGDTGRIDEVTDTAVTIHNATNQDFYARVVMR